jgi:hypothetical protein
VDCEGGRTSEARIGDEASGETDAASTSRTPAHRCARWCCWRRLLQPAVVVLCSAPRPSNFVYTPDELPSESEYMLMLRRGMRRRRSWAPGGHVMGRRALTREVRCRRRRSLWGERKRRAEERRRAEEMRRWGMRIDSNSGSPYIHLHPVYVRT